MEENPENYGDPIKSSEKIKKFSQFIVDQEINYNIDGTSKGLINPLVR